MRSQERGGVGEWLHVMHGGQGYGTGYAGAATGVVVLRRSTTGVLLDGFACT
jgi:hypothetical protein